MDSNRDPRTRTNQYYIAQLNSMEIKISELKAQLHAKDFEIDYLSSKCSSLASSSQYKDLELKLTAVMNENDSLKKKNSELDEMQIIKSQLEQALHMKEIFEQRYRELKSRSMVVEKIDQMLENKEKEIQNLTAELELAKKSQRDAEAQLWSATNELKSAKDELTDSQHKGLNEGKKKVQIRLKNKEIIRPYSVTNSSKSPLKILQETQNRRTNFMQSPKCIPNNDDRYPRVVSISLENSLLRPFYKC